MHFVCNKCNTKYSIPDSKIAGKILKLRCKKCQNIIVVKDPKAVSALRKRTQTQSVQSVGRQGTGPPQKPSKGKALLQQAFKNSFNENIPPASKSFGGENENRSDNSDKTQIAQIPSFSDNASEEDWYLADTRGQFGPMNLSELIARIKRGEPDSDAVVWRDGFNDWLLIHEVPELKPYRKHAPPPRKRITESNIVSSSQEMQQYNEPYPATSSPNGTGQFQVNRTGQFQANRTGQFQANRSGQFQENQFGGIPSNQQMNGNSMPLSAQNMMGDSQYMATNQGALPKSKMLYIIIGVSGFIAILVIAWFAYSLGKTTNKDSDNKQKDQVALQNNKKPVVNNNVIPKAPSNNNNMKPQNVIYVLADDSGDTKTNNSNPKASTANNKVVRRKNLPNLSNLPDLSKTNVVTPKGPSRSKEDLRKVVNNNRDKIARCYQITVRKGQSALVASKVTLHISVKSNGSISGVSFSGAMPPMMKKCLRRKVNGFKFPKGSRTGKVSYTMHFSN
jgi:predicted Zn finger-like uncharacterized protein